MEVAGQWRREWAGTAEYGKVTEGGVTRQVARAMEVLHASAPGARVRVMRAAYHATAGPGAPASTYLMHSSRRVITSGYNFIEPESSPTRPLEISSTPLESSPELEIENENYKVTEPDDLDISQPSKWRGSKSINSIRMPSEESSSTDNASVIDLDYSNKNSVRKHIETFTPHTRHKRTSPISSLLDTPVTLSTLKYKSLLNGNDSWNNRRKSYSFEETPELDESVLKNTDAVNMESSTDSGICKSSEIVNSENNHLENSRHTERKTRMDDIHEETFKDWLSKNRQKSYMNQTQSTKEHIIGIELCDNSKITLQSAGKVSITLPTSTNTNDNYDLKKAHTNEDSDKRAKKVEFCKTELHFAAESGTVNIIATDEKPPPSTDFRKKRSMFVPMSNNYNKSITLFGEKTDVLETSSSSSLMNTSIDENTAATKSILKNKIPKPKPYLLGENMVFGDSINHASVNVNNEINNNFTKPTGVSLINGQINPERKFSTDSRSSIGSDNDWSSFKNSYSRTSKIGPVDNTRPSQEIEQKLPSKLETQTAVSDVIKAKVKMLHISPTSPRARTRQLRESDLTYFGVNKPGEKQTERRKHSLDSIFDENNLKEDILHSVNLVKLISNSVCNSEAESDDAPDYENFPMKYNLSSKPTLRSHSKYHSYLDGNKEEKELNSILERDDDIIVVESRRPKTKTHTSTPASRSISEPPKANKHKSLETSVKPHIKTNRPKDSSLSRNNTDTIGKSQKNKISEPNFTYQPRRRTPESPLYANFKTKDTKKVFNDDDSQIRSKQQSIERQKQDKKSQKSNIDSRNTQYKKTRNRCNSDTSNSNITEKRIDPKNQQTEEHVSDGKKTRVNRTKILVTPEKSPVKCRESFTKRAERNSFKEKHLTNAPRIRSSKIENKDCVRDSQSDRDNKEVISLAIHKEAKAPTVQKHRQKLSVDTSVTGSQNSSKEHHVAHPNDIKATEIIMTQPKINKDKTEKVNKTENKPRRSKYVINYDDKNGTVSSICKVKSDHGTTKMKKIVNYDNKENIKTHTLKKNNIPNKTDLLQLRDQDRILYGSSRTKSKIRVQQSCHIL